MQMLSEVISSRPAYPPSPALLLGDGLQSGQQSCQPSTLALHARERRLLPRPGERRPGPGVAVAPSWVLAQSSTCRRCVTRSLNGRTHWFYYQNGQFGALSVTRDLNRATCCSDWLNCPYPWNTFARGHRPHHGPFATTGPRHSRYIRGAGGNARAERRSPVVIDYETFCKIHDCHDRQGLTIAQTARALGP